MARTGNSAPISDSTRTKGPATVVQRRGPSRKAVPPDASGIVKVLEAVTAERIHSAIDHVWTVEHETRHLESLAPREVFHVAVDATAGVVGFQSLDLWSSLLSSMAHVGQVGTFLLPGWRGLGVGRQLCDVLANVFREDLVDQRLVADAPAMRFLAQRLEDAWIEADRDQSARFVTERRPPHPPHRLELLGRRRGNVRVVNPSRRTPHVRGDSPAAR